MRKYMRFGCFLPLLAVLVALTASAWARTKDSRTLKLEYPVKLSGTELPAGVYKLAWGSGTPDGKVTLEKGKEVVGTLEGKWVERDSKYDHDTVVYDARPDGSRHLSEIRFAGSNKVLVVGQEPATGGM